ncbi:methyltransferase domain-containing protein [Rhodocyclus tenuis]|uniref:Methyltransferase domain-containing protein n=2 Tax=Rhodocyclus TaxID=1064 RepID=A0A6L5JVH0_RHOTE|nr:methyltransferase domain-containing protein [Rhodocyclus gracilis]MQY51031.1 methyltransferase domain-containing protein [Rhodocyclus gracilis]MRD73010.1 methyltransferase domain-containing protein [Rhodocyclus gracilis]NJA88741.1 methyltransferase domain-containing protein [Rhodocyclus gracilis]
MRLHFGAFNCPREGWINTDVTPHVHISRIPGLARVIHALGKMSDQRLVEHQRGVFRKVEYLDVTKPWRYGSGSFDAIFSSHVFEHLPLHGARNCLKESYRCLKTGGVIRLSVPDLDAYISRYLPEHSLDWAIGFFEANETSEKNMHHFMYNFDSLSALLHSVGFSSIQRQHYKQGRCPDVEKMDNRPDSLFVEAIK